MAYYNLNDKFIGINGLDNHYAHSKVNLGKSWIQKLNYNTEEVIMVGDTIHDFEVAKAIGVDCLLLSFGHNSKSRLEKLNVPIVCSYKKIIDNILS